MSRQSVIFKSRPHMLDLCTTLGSRTGEPFDFCLKILELNLIVYEGQAVTFLQMQNQDISFEKNEAAIDDQALVLAAVKPHFFSRFKFILDLLLFP